MPLFSSVLLFHILSNIFEELEQLRDQSGYSRLVQLRFTINPQLKQLAAPGRGSGDLRIRGVV